MKWFCICVLGLLCLSALGVWLGWGRVGDWQQVSGWSALSEDELSWECSSASGFSHIETHPDLKWLGHATVQIDWGGLRLLSDPLRSSRVKVAPRLFDRPILDPANSVDVILITHAHMDHLDNDTLVEMAPSRILLPAGTERFLSEAVRTRHQVIPLQFGDVFELGAVEIIPVTARHGGWRYPWQRGLFACGYVVRCAGQALYVAGDSATGAHFAEIGKAYQPRYAVLPIGAYSPQWFLKSRHLNPEEALAAAAELGAEFVIPYHFGTLRLSLEPVDEPLRRFSAVALRRKQKWILPVPNPAK